jgi:outer membrane receptor protein involved in Fe transport
VKDFFSTGHTASTNISVTGGTDRASARLSLGSDNTAGIIPNNFFQKASGLLNGTLQVNDKLSTNATLSYVRNTARNRPGVGYGQGVLEQFIWFGRNVDVNALKGFPAGGATNGGPDNRELNWNYNFHNNPWWLQDDNPEYDARDRFIASASANYKVTDWLSASLSTGSDIYRYNIDQRFAEGNLNNADPSYSGGFDFFNEYRNENNTQLLLTASKPLTSRIQFNGTAGGNLRSEQYNNNDASTSGISVANIYNVSNAAITPAVTQQVSRRQVNGVYGSAGMTWDGWWTVEGTARNDWSSTLPQGQNSYFYPSINSSLLLTDMMPGIKKGGLSFLKLRGSYAKVGSDAQPYQLATTYAGNSNKFNGLPQFSLSNVISNPVLKPEITTSSEGGVEAAWFDGRVTLDASYYGKSTRDQIFNITISPATGFAQKALNAGRVDNKGVEALVTVIPIRASNGFEWTSTVNYSHNASKVVSLSPGIKTIVLGSTWNTNVEAREGQPYGAIFGYSFLRDSATGQLITSGGLTQRGPLKVLGNSQPKWVGSFNNTFAYKNYSLNLLFDARRGGQFFSVSNFWGDYAGITKNSLIGREVDWNNPGVVVKGLDKASCVGGHAATDGMWVCPQGKANTTNVTSEEYWQDIYPVVEQHILTNNWVKLRELRVGYDLPTHLANRIRMSSANLSVVGRNLWMSTNIPNIDPEFSYTTGNAGGFAEFAALPNARSVGLTLRVTP